MRVAQRTQLTFKVSRILPIWGVPCVYLGGTGNEQVTIIVYVDDMLITAPCRLQVDTVKQAIVNKWKIENNGPAKELLKIKIMCDQRNQPIDLDQQAYIKEIINEWIMPDQKTWVPMTKAPTKAPEGLEIKDNLKRKYPILVGKLLWAMQVALCGVKYLNQTQDEILQIGGEDMDGSTIKAYTDAHWASDANTDWKSTSGSIIKMYGGVVTWNLHVQKCVASSAVEAKYIASSVAT
ncbi:uncharacterized protein UHOD_12349 [Ustilago sp. UG-2017b]|nr:uncharacterized protein UHOD_12349 [Ustilago sp. UG-2017b]